MSVNMPEQRTRIENRERDDVRYLGYDLLKNVSFNGEPVVPAIISHGADNDKQFTVEELGGTDLWTIAASMEVSPMEKLRLIHHVVGQLQTIDQAGLVLFDRAGRNVRVLSFGSSGISTRQVDIEYFFDKLGGRYLSSGYTLGDEAKVKYYRENGFNLWGETANQLSSLVERSLRSVEPKKGRSIERKFSPLAWGEYDEHIKAGKKKSPNPLSNQDVLSVLKLDIEKLITRLE